MGLGRAYKYHSDPAYIFSRCLTLSSSLVQVGTFRYHPLQETLQSVDLLFFVEMTPMYLVLTYFLGICGW